MTAFCHHFDGKNYNFSLIQQNDSAIICPQNRSFESFSLIRFYFIFLKNRVQAYMPT